MKKNSILIGMMFFTSMLLISCGGSGNSNEGKDKGSPIESVNSINDEANVESDVAPIEESNDAEEVSSNSSANSSDCDEFLKDYEDFMDDYIAVLKKYKNDPTDMTIMTEYQELMGKANTWSSKVPDCNDPEFLEKYAEIQQKLSNAAAGL